MKELNEFKNWLEKIKSGKIDDLEEEKLNFVWELMKTPYIQYHYELIKNKYKIDDDFWLDLKSRFDEHGEDGEKFLLSKLEKNEDIDFHSEIIYLLGEISLNKNKSIHKNETLKYARILAESENCYTREKAIIVLGWLGKIEDLTIFENHILNDEFLNCRAWSASSIMQIWFRKKTGKLELEAFKIFEKAFKKEKDYFVLSTIISAIQEIGQKKFGISQKSIDLLEKEKIDIAKIKAENFINKLTKLI